MQRISLRLPCSVRYFCCALLAGGKGTYRKCYFHGQGQQCCCVQQASSSFLLRFSLRDCKKGKNTLLVNCLPFKKVFYAKAAK